MLFPDVRPSCDSADDPAQRKHRGNEGCNPDTDDRRVVQGKNETKHVTYGNKLQHHSRRATPILVLVMVLVTAREVAGSRAIRIVIGWRVSFLVACRIPPASRLTAFWVRCSETDRQQRHDYRSGELMVKRSRRWFMTPSGGVCCQSSIKCQQLVS
jgi:hypothetical protein